MSNENSVVGTIAGKHVHAIPSRRAAATMKELRKYIRQFSVDSALRELSLQCAQLENHNKYITQDGITTHVLSYLSMLAIECCREKSGRHFNTAALHSAVEIYWALRDPVLEELERIDKELMQVQEAAELLVLSRAKQEALEAFLIRQGLHAFHYQGEQRHLLPRTHMLLSTLWPMIESGQGISPTSDIRQIHGMEFDEITRYGQVFSGRASSDGMIIPYTDSEAERIPSGLRDLFNQQKLAEFLERFSIDLTTFRDLCKQIMPTDDYDKYRFNPLIRHPIVRIPRKHGETRYYVPCIRLLHERTTEGLYHDLSDYYRDRAVGSQKFRNAFGLVFQAYIGRLLLEALGPTCVHAEWKYVRDGQPVDTPDWIVVENNKAVIIEVKQSALFLESKKFGKTENLARDLKKNVGAAVKQLKHFDTDIQKRLPGLSKLLNVAQFERLIITYDAMYYSNSILKKALDPVMHCHIASVEEFEYLLGYCWNGSLFDLLNRKRVKIETDMLDFSDWMASLSGEHRNPFLLSIFDDLQKAYM